MQIASSASSLGAAVFLVVALGGTAIARPDRGHSVGASINIDAGFDHADSLQREGINLGIRAGISPRRTVMAVAGFDLSLGLAQPTGFAYETNLSPIGVGVILGPVGRFTIVGGIGVSGVTGSVTVAGHLPLEARLDLRLGGRVRLEMSAAIAEVFGRDTREAGAAHAPFGDELKLQTNVRIGKTYLRHDFRSSNGYYLGAVYREFAGLQSIGIVAGHSLDFAR